MARDTSWLSRSPAAVLPSREAAALAIAILRTKPANVNVRDYVMHLRQHLKHGPPPSEAEQHHHMDLVNYWRDQYLLEREECERLRNTNVKLERSNQQLSNHSSVTLEERPSTPLSSSNLHPASPLRSPRRRKSPSKAAPLDPNAQTQGTIESDFDLYEGLGLDGENLIEGLHFTHRLCRALNTQPDLLCHSLLRTASALGKVIRFVAGNHDRLSKASKRSSAPRSLGDDKSEFALALTAAARAFMSILVGVSKMSGISEDSRLSSLIICELVEMFKITLSSIERCARCSADSIASAPPPSKKTKLNKITLSPDSAPARSLAHFLIGLLGLLDASNIFHQKLFDGFMFLLLEKASSRMYFCTFGRHRPRTIDEDAYFPVPNATEPNHHQKEGSEELAIRMELKVLILILQRAMGLAPHHMKQGSKDSLPSSTNHVSRTLSMKTLPSAPRTRLSTLAKDRLQRTFVTCMFGGRQDDEFLDVLTKPVPSMRASTLPNSARIDEEGVEQWYKEEMWRLVGWDIMVREGLR